MKKLILALILMGSVVVAGDKPFRKYRTFTIQDLSGGSTVKIKIESDVPFTIDGSTYTQKTLTYKVPNKINEDGDYDYDINVQKMDLNIILNGKF